MGSEKLPQDNQEDRRERRGDSAGETVKLLSMKQKKMSEATDGQFEWQQVGLGSQG